MTYSSSHSKLMEELEPNPVRAQQQRPQHYVLLAWALPTDAPGLTLALPAWSSESSPTPASWLRPTPLWDPFLPSHPS